MGTPQTGNDDSSNDDGAADSKGSGKGNVDTGSNDGHGGSADPGAEARNATIPSNVTTASPSLQSVVVNIPKNRSAAVVFVGIVLGVVVVIAALVFFGVRCRREMQYKRIERLGLRSTTAMENVAYEHTSPVADGSPVSITTGKRLFVNLAPNSMYSSGMSNDGGKGGFVDENNTYDMAPPGQRSATLNSKINPTFTPDGDNTYATAVPGVRSTTLRAKGNPKGRSQQPTYATIQDGQYAEVQHGSNGSNDVQYATYAGGGAANNAGKGGAANEQYAGWEHNAMYAGAAEFSARASGSNSNSNEQYAGWEHNAMYAGADSVETRAASGPRLRSNSMWSVGNMQRDRSGSCLVEAQQQGVAYAVPFVAEERRGAARCSVADGSAANSEA